jgi:transglutaminase-like putative cysteine protease
MGRLIRKGSTSPQIRSTAVSLAMQQKTDIDKIRNVFNFVKSRMRYIRDNAFMETVASSDFHLKSFVQSGYAAGDCDDHVVLLGSLLTSIGYPVRIVTVRVRPGYGAFDHVYLEVLIRGTWIPLDATNKRMPLGWAVPKPSRIKKWII